MILRMKKETKTKENTAEEIITKEKKSKNKKIPKEISQEILKQIFKNLLIAIFVIAYFAILNFANATIKQERLIEDLKVFAGVFLVIGIVLLEKAYKEDEGKLAIPAIEWIIMSLHTLSIMHVINMFEYNFAIYLLTSSYIFAIYFVLKCIIIYTKGRKDYLKQFSDISEIVKKDEPIVKEATKKSKEEKAINNKEDNNNEKNKKKTKQEDKKETKQKQTKQKANKANKNTKKEVKND